MWLSAGSLSRRGQTSRRRGRGAQAQQWGFEMPPGPEEVPGAWDRWGASLRDGCLEVLVSRLGPWQPWRRAPEPCLARLSPQVRSPHSFPVPVVWALPDLATWLVVACGPGCCAS